MLIFNPKDTTVEFIYGGRHYFYAPKEIQTVDEITGRFILERARCGLVEYEGQEEAVSEETYVTMPWRKLVALGSARGLFKPGFGTKREELIKLMENYDQEGRTLQEPTNKEEGAGA